MNECELLLQTSVWHWRWKTTDENMCDVFGNRTVDHWSALRAWNTWSALALELAVTAHPHLPIDLMRVQDVEPPQTPPDRELCFPTERGKDGRKVVDVGHSAEQLYHQVFPRIRGNSLRSFGEDARQGFRLRSQNTRRMHTPGITRPSQYQETLKSQTLTQEMMGVQTRLL